MSAIFFIIVFAASAILVPRKIPDYFTISEKHVTRAGEKVQIAWVRTPVRFLLIFLALLVAGQTSYVIIDADKIGLLNKVYGSKSLEQGRIVASNGETGQQAQILGPGLNIKFLVNVLYKVDSFPVHEVPLGSYGMITAKDGLPLKANQIFAGKWKPGTESDMMKAEYFLGDGKGQKGPQATILKPGKYRYNPYLFAIHNKPAIKIKPGYVGVVKSAVQELPDSECKPVEPRQGIDFSVKLVPKGCRGLWSTVFGPGTYYMNGNAYKITTIASRVQTWNYMGGYTKRWINLTIEQNGKIDQQVDVESIPVPMEAAASAVMLKIDGWEVPLEIRTTIQVDPVNAPMIVAAIGGLEEVQKKIFTPLIRSVARNIISANFAASANLRTTAGKNKTGGQSPSRVLELRNKRKLLETEVFEELKVHAGKIGLTLRQLKFGDPVLPPELLVAHKREQLADQMKQTFTREEAAQKKRIELEKATAEANQQNVLMKAEIEKKAAQHRKEAKYLEGQGEKLKLQEIAKGQKAQVAVLGSDKTMQLAVIDKLLNAAVKNPEIVKVPRISVQGGGSSGGGSLEGAFAILGDSSLTKGMDMDAMSHNK